MPGCCVEMTQVMVVQEAPVDIGSFGKMDSGFEGARGDYDSGRAGGSHASPERSLNAFAPPIRCMTCGGMGHQAAVCPSGAAF